MRPASLSNLMLNVLLSGSQQGSLTMCTFRTQNLTAAQSLWRKAWNASRGQTQAPLKGNSIACRQAGPYVPVTSLRDTFPDQCRAPCQRAPSWKSTGPHGSPPHSWKHSQLTCADPITRVCLRQEKGAVVKTFRPFCDVFDRSRRNIRSCRNIIIYCTSPPGGLL